MTKENRIIDFIAFILLDYEELLSNANYFFWQESKHPLQDQNEVIPNYMDFLKEYIVTDKIVENDTKVRELKSLKNLLTNKELINLIKYLEYNFNWGYPDADNDGVYGGNLSLKLTEEEIKDYFSNYLSYYQINQDAYISYFIAIFNTLDESVHRQLKTETRKIDSILYNKKSLPNNLQSEYVTNRYNSYKNRLFNDTADNTLQFLGFTDVNGVYFNQRKTISTYLQFLKEFAKNGHSIPPTAD